MPLHNSEHSSPDSLFAALRHQVLDGPGSTPPRVRHAVASARLNELSEELRPYVATIREHAWRSTDEQVQELIAVGWSEDQVYELTLATALGAGQQRLEQGLAAMAKAAQQVDVDALSGGGGF